MFILDSLLIAGIRWSLQTALTAAEAEMNDDTVLRDELMLAESRREAGEISDDKYREIEADLLARIREIKQRREGGSGPLTFDAAEPAQITGDSRFHVEASVSGDFHDPAGPVHAKVVDTHPVHESALGHLVDAHGVEQIGVLDLDRHVPRPPKRRTARTTRTTRTRTTRTSRTTPRKR